MRINSCSCSRSECGVATVRHKSSYAILFWKGIKAPNLGGIPKLICIKIEDEFIGSTISNRFSKWSNYTTILVTHKSPVATRLLRLLWRPLEHLHILIISATGSRRPIQLNAVFSLPNRYWNIFASNHLPQHPYVLSRYSRLSSPKWTSWFISIQ